MQLSVVLHADLDRQAFAPFARKIRLFQGNSDADDRGSVFLGCVFREASPPATDVEDAVA